MRPARRQTPRSSDVSTGPASRRMSWRKYSAGDPRNPGRPIEIDPQRSPARRLRAEPDSEFVQGAARRWRPRDFRDRGKPGKHLVLDIAHAGDGLGPERRFHAEN